MKNTGFPAPSQTLFENVIYRSGTQFPLILWFRTVQENGPICMLVHGVNKMDAEQSSASIK